MNRMEKAFDKEGLRIKTAIPYDGGFLVNAEAKDGSALTTTTLYIYQRGRFFKDLIMPYYPAEHTDEFGDVLKRLEEARKKGKTG